MWTGIVTVAQWAWNAAMTANPIGLIIAGIVALIAAISYVVYKTDGWGKQWDSVVKFMKFSFSTYVESVKLNFSTMVNGIMMGLEYIKKGWYNFKNALGIGNDKENNNAISKINASIENRQKAITEGAKKVIALGKKAKSSLKWELNWNSNKSLSDITKKIKGQMGMSTKGVTPNDSSLVSATPNLEQTTENIVTGGKRQTVLTINIDKVVETIEQKVTDGVAHADEVVDQVLDSLTRRLQGTARGLIS
ncbi:phage tail tape measure protein [Elysia marginata]|uniref:Phage tail tape measure protein n=1 Tax=Elysia marginata TaxID=1093978 RepID=A0AAV4FQ68_9GAST|nr:phage tail tape measure protein [Elysia marginata]